MKKQNEVVIGVDPGTALCGYGVVKETGGSFSAMDFGTITTSKDEMMHKRLETIFSALNRLVKIYRPDAMSIERLFFNKNVVSAISVGQARGVCLLVAAINNLRVYEYTPAEIKLSLTGNGRAQKKQVGYMVKSLLRLDEIPKPDDTADALGTALCCLFRFEPGPGKISHL